MAKTVDIPIDKWMAQLKELYYKIEEWILYFFRTIDTYESIAVGAMGLGFIMLIIGIIIL